MKFEQPQIKKQEEKLDQGDRVEDKQSIDKKIESILVQSEEKHYSIKSEDFNFILDNVFKDNSLFYKYNAQLERLLSSSLEDERLHWSLTKSPENLTKKEYKTQMDKFVNPYLETLFDKYKNGSFSDKVKSLQFFLRLCSGVMFTGTYYAARNVRDFFEEEYHKPNREKDNYYISTYLDAMYNKEKYGADNEKEIAKGQFFYKEIHTNKIFISDIKFYDIAKKLNDKIKEQSKISESYIIKKEIKNMDGGTTTTYSQNSPKYKKSQKILHDMNEEWLSFFHEISERDFLLTKDKHTDDFFDQEFFFNQSVRKNFKDKTNLSLNEFSLPEQYRFFNYTKEITNKEAERFNSFLKKFGRDSFRTFLSVEHGGKEMGDTILELGEKLPEDEAKQIFEGYSRLIDSSEKIEQTLVHAFSRDDEMLQSVPFQIRDALLLRAKDVLVGAHKIVASPEESKLDHRDVLDALAGITRMLDILSDVGQKENFNFAPNKTTEKNLFKYRVEDKENHAYNLKIFIRPEAEQNAQARINFELSFDTDKPDERLQRAFKNEVISHTQNKTMSGSVLRIGIDREEYGGEENISLDLGRSEREDAELSRTGDVLGNLLAYTSTEGHHTTSPFDKKLATKENFARIANQLLEYLKYQEISR